MNEQVAKDLASRYERLSDEERARFWMLHADMLAFRMSKYWASRETFTGPLRDQAEIFQNAGFFPPIEDGFEDEAYRRQRRDKVIANVVVWTLALLPLLVALLATSWRR